MSTVKDRASIDEHLLTILDIIRNNPGVSRKNIATIGGINPSTVTYLTALLIDNGFITEGDTIRSNNGRRPVGIFLHSECYNASTVYHDGSCYRIAFFSFDGTVIEDAPLDVDEYPQADTLVNEIAEKFNKITKRFSKHSTLGITVVLPTKPFYGIWIDFGDICEKIRELTGVSVRFINRATAGVVTHWLARGLNNRKGRMVYLDIGDEIDCSIIIDGQPLFENEPKSHTIGHTSINFNGEICRCGRRGCLNAYASNHAVIKSLKEKKNFIDNTVLTENSSLQDIAQAYKNQDELAEFIINSTAPYVALSIVSLINFYKPTEIVVGGQTAIFGAGYFQTIKELAERSYSETQPLPAQLIHCIDQNVEIIGSHLLTIQHSTLRYINL